MIPTRLYQRSYEFRFAGLVQYSDYISIVWSVPNTQFEYYSFLPEPNAKVGCYYDPLKITSEESPVLAAIESATYSKKLVVPRLIEAAVALNMLAGSDRSALDRSRESGGYYTTVCNTRYTVPRLANTNLPSLSNSKLDESKWVWAIDRNSVVHVIKPTTSPSFFTFSGVHTDYPRALLPVAIDKFWRT